MVIEYSLEAAEQYAECQTFCQWFKRRVSPLLANQSWYSEPERLEL
jgi:hypothetical protein